jgi:hypothetical protein
MAANPKSPVLMDGVKTSHEYHAEAHVLSGHLQLPVRQPIQHHALVVLKDPRGGHFTQFSEDYSLEGLISFKTGRTRVSGSPGLKAGHGFVTLSTSVIEGLNVFEVITADRMVAQVSTDHLVENPHVPEVTFLGTRFENLRIGGYPIEVELDLKICGEKPEHDKMYKQDPEFLDRVGQQCASIVRKPGLPTEVKAQYDEELAYLDELKERCNGSGKGGPSASGKGGSDRPITCSLVKNISGKLPPGVNVFGNLLEIPGFGMVSLAEVEVGTETETGSHGDPRISNYFTVRMLNMKLGCIGHGEVVAGHAKTNGQTSP